MLIGNAVVDAYPLVSVVVGPHAVVEHVPAFLDEFGECTSCLLVFGVFADVVHRQNDLFAHQSALDGSISVIQQVTLVLFNRLLATVLQDLSGSSVL